MNKGKNVFEEGDICICPECKKKVKVVILEGGELGLKKHGDCLFSEKSFIEISEINEKSIAMAIIFSILLPDSTEEFIEAIENTTWTPSKIS